MPRRNLSNDTVIYRKSGRLVAAKRAELGKTEEQAAKGTYMRVDRYKSMEKGSARPDLHSRYAVTACFKCGLNVIVLGKPEPKKKAA